MRNDREYLLDIAEAIEQIEKYAERGRKAFESDELIQSWVIRHLQIIGEAVRRLSPEFRSQHPEIPWSEITGMRNVLVHDYFSIDTAAVWAAVERDIPSLKKIISKLLRDPPGN